MLQNNVHSYYREMQFQLHLFCFIPVVRNSVANSVATELRTTIKLLLYMQVFINQQAHQTEAQTLYDLLTEKGLINKTGIAVALNQQIIPRSVWNEKQIIENDVLTIITATQGG